jgi:hypothetical protein
MDKFDLRLREMSASDFESLIQALLSYQYPGAGITRVDGSGGDEGIDSFAGNLADGPSVWQCKHLPRAAEGAPVECVLHCNGPCRLIPPNPGTQQTP